MRVDLEKEPRRLTLHYPSTKSVMPPIQFPITFTSMIADEKGSLWDIEVSNLLFDSRHKKEPLVNVSGKIIVRKDKKKL